MAYNRQRSAGFKNGQPLGDRTKFDAPRRKIYRRFAFSVAFLKLV